MRKKFIILPFIVCMFFSSNIFSQNIEGVNARLDAMAGSAAADDIGWTIQHPQVPWICVNLSVRY